ncbi:hypothetical protein PsorP6_019119 [Peronosclerospora sorghi]|nr:hypothetical protein PsorP6_019119 [Peronosclerospora sorghi]
MNMTSRRLEILAFLYSVHCFCKSTTTESVRASLVRLALVIASFIIESRRVRPKCFSSSEITRNSSGF